MRNYKEEIADFLTDPTGLPREQILSAISKPPQREQGDFAFPCFPLAKSLRKPPPVIAQEFAQSIKLPDGFSKLEAMGGYLNFHVDRKSYVQEVLTEIHRTDAGYGESREGNGRTVLVDFSSPNLGKELAFHHLRGTSLGSSLSRLYAKAGYTVKRLNYLGDWGTSFGKLIVMYQYEGLPTDDASLSAISIESLNRLYQKFARASHEDPELEDKAREAFARLEKGDKLYLKLWLYFREATLRELQRLYSMMGVEFDDYTGEAHYIPMTTELLAELESKNLVKESRGARIVDLSEYDMPPLMLVKTDGSTVYATRDLCAALERREKHGFHRCLYVTDNGQALHFKQVFRTLALMDRPWHRDMEHVPFGLILNKSEDGSWIRGKTRAGHASLLKDVFDKAAEKIEGIISEKNSELENRSDIARKVGIGALIFDSLKNKRLNDIKFEWDKVLSFEGDTGPYVQNAHVRLCSILRKSGRRSIDTNVRTDRLSAPEEQALIDSLAQLPERIVASLRLDDPYLIAQYCLEVSEKVHAFVHACRVLGSEEETERLYLVDAARIVLRNSLDILGVPAIETM